MSRGQVRFLIASVVLLLITMVGYRLLEQTRQQEPPIEVPPDPPTASEQRMHNFKRMKIRPDGQKAWEIIASKARYLTDDHLVIVESPQFSFYPKDGEAFSLRSREAHVFLTSDKKEEVMRVELSGDLEMKVGEFVITTQEATFETEKNLISSLAVVQINGPGVTVTGHGYSVDVVNKYVTLDTDVQTTLSRRDS